MSSITPNARPDFFGKDKFTSFIGVVEDVNDPKQSGRVKVRCVGWHPKAKEGDESGDGLTTDDLPWAKVGMPVTHAQQSRIGGKHGLLPGCWVIGFFLDGEEAQDPFILTTFNFTASASDQDYRQAPEGTDGKFADEDIPFDKNEVGGENQPNIDTRQTSEREQKGYSSPTDISGDVVNDDSDNPETGQKSRQSSASYRRQNDGMKVGEQGNAESQKYEVAIGDGLCGTIAHGREDMTRRMKERMPSQFSRIVYNDAVWNRFTGSFMNINSILIQLAFEFAQTLKSPANSIKAYKERTQNRPQKQQKIIAKPDRDGELRFEIDDKDTKKRDAYHALYQESLIDQLVDIIMAILQALNSAGSEASISGPSDITSTANTAISNFEATCLVDGLLGAMNSACEDALAAAEEASETDSGFDLGAIVGLLTGGSVSDSMQWPLLQKYANQRSVFNHAGSRSQDILTKDQGCKPERVYNTEMGSLGASAGSSGGAGSSGSDGSGTGAGGLDLSSIGFAGGPAGAGAGSGTISTPCGGSLEIVVPIPQGTGGANFLFTVDGINLEDWAFAHNPNGPVIVPATDPNTFPIDWTRVKFKPNGKGARLNTISLPSSDPAHAANFNRGIPNLVLVRSPGKHYYFANPVSPEEAFPSIYIKGYNGTPIPVLDRNSGEFVAVLTNPNSWSRNEVDPTATAIPDENITGILTDDPDWNVQLGGMFIENTGFAYENPEFAIIDKDTGRENGKVKATVQEGRIVDLEITDAGSFFKRIPEVRILGKKGDQPGFGAKIRPVMSVTPRDGAPDPYGIEVIYCPAKNQLNYTETLNFDPSS